MYDVGNPGPGSGVGTGKKNVVMLIRLMGCEHYPLNNWISNGNTWRLSVKYELRSESKDLLAQNHDIVYKWNDVSSYPRTDVSVS